MGVLPMSPEESLLPENGLHRRWTLHGVSHMLGMDVHDCDKARDEDYILGTLKEGITSAIPSMMKNEINIKIDFKTRIAPAILDDISGLSLYTEICRAAE